jgi:hypothetical protein
MELLPANRARESGRFRWMRAVRVASAGGPLQLVDRDTSEHLGGHPRGSLVSERRMLLRPWITTVKFDAWR